ncbi:MAG: 50S ribosome-binding GTPase [Candidatus Muirbacterium halophilum]|nr:50S ribosome-binding GTPase [Candidatus Muirbacterium halophilum]MCK9474912.1 50S ribosome-binding GTPase [Candidatus Muirbacterium halophilum]
MDNKLSWYPGHIKAARQKIRARFPKIDILIEIIDARAPISSASGIFDEIPDKKHFLVINKCDLVDNDIVNEIKNKFYGKDVFFISALNRKSIADLFNNIKAISVNNIDKLVNYGFKNKSSFVMIAGMPNVGKTQLIKQISGKKKLRIANRPGVTRSEQWITYENLRIMDTPGVLYPEVDDEDIIYKLAVINCVDASRIGYSEVLEFFWNNIEEKGQKILTDGYLLGKCQHFSEFLIEFEKKYSIKGNDNIATKVFSDYNKGKFKKIILDKLNEV